MLINGFIIPQWLFRKPDSNALDWRSVPVGGLPASWRGAVAWMHLRVPVEGLPLAIFPFCPCLPAAQDLHPPPRLGGNSSLSSVAPASVLGANVMQCSILIKGYSSASHAKTETQTRIQNRVQIQTQIRKRTCAHAYEFGIWISVH